MAYEIASASNHDDLFEKLRTFLKAAGPVGPGWTELYYTGVAPKTMVLKATGLAGGEEIFFAFRLYTSGPSDTFGLYGWMFKTWNAGFAPDAQVGQSTILFHPTWDSTTPYWFFANGHRLIFVTKQSTSYWSSYFGRFLQYGTPGEYGLPWYCAMPWNAPVRYSTIHESIRNFWDPGGTGLILFPSGVWRGATNFYDNSGNEAYPSGATYLHPYAGPHGGMVHERFREMTNNLDGSYTLFPITLVTMTPEYSTFGELDGAFALSGYSLASEDTVTVGGDTYLVFQNGFRTAQYQFCAIKRA